MVAGTGKARCGERDFANSAISWILPFCEFGQFGKFGQFGQFGQFQKFCKFDSSVNSEIRQIRPIRPIRQIWKFWKFGKFCKFDSSVNYEIRPIRPIRPIRTIRTIWKFCKFDKSLNSKILWIRQFGQFCQFGKFCQFGQFGKFCNLVNSVSAAIPTAVGPHPHRVLPSNRTNVNAGAPIHRQACEGIICLLFSSYIKYTINQCVYMNTYISINIYIYI